MLRSVLLLCLVAAMWGAPAVAGPNSSGVLFLHTNPLQGSGGDPTPYCPQVVLDRCENADTRHDGTQSVVFWAMAAFPDGSSPRVSGLTFGILFDGSRLSLLAQGNCADFELGDSNWPASGSGTALTFNVPMTSTLFAVYWFAAYNYYAPAPTTFSLSPHPTQGGDFADDSVPALLDPIAGYGVMGFDTDGSVPCGISGEAGACCRVNGSCIFVLPDVCVAEGGVFQGQGVPCLPETCPPGPIGACCDQGNGSCAVTDSSTCVQIEGLYQGDGTDCDPNPCPIPPVGACCYNDASCGVRSQYDCVRSGGSWLGEGTVCDPNPCPGSENLGACCYNNGICIVTEPQFCGGDFLGEGTDCTPNPCDAIGDPLACCFVDGTCLLLLEADCDSLGGVSVPVITCDPNPCPTPVIGACCGCDQNQGAWCVVTDRPACEGSGGFYLGDGTSCSPFPCDCDAQGACCYPDGTCAVVAKFDCESFGGYYQGGYTDCDPDPCPPPVPTRRESWGSIKSRYR